MSLSVPTSSFLTKLMATPLLPNRPLRPMRADTLATLIEPDGRGNSAFLLTGNYRVILHYNCSNYYALSVGLLADEIAR
mgnify:CR=1 FL=1